MKKLIKLNSPDIYGYFALAILTIVFFHEQLFNIQDFWSNYWADWTEITVPFFKLNILAVQNGEMPFWNPYAYGGTTHLAEPTSLFYYPVFFVLHYVVSPDANLEGIVSNVIILHFFITALNTFILSRFLKISVTGSLLASVAFTFSSAMVCKWQYVIVICGLSWLPLVFLYYIKIYRSKTIVWSDVIKGGIFLAMTFAGHAQYFFYTIFFLSMTVLFVTMIDNYEKKNLKVAAFSLVKLGIPVLISFLIICIQVLPTAEIIKWTQRSSISYDFAADGSFQFKQFLTFLSQRIFGYYKGGDPLDFTNYFATLNKQYHYWETGYFFGVIPLLFGIWGAYISRKKSIVVALIIASLIYILHALGSNAFLFKFLFQLPGFSSFRLPSRTLLYPIFLLCLSAGFAIDYVRRSSIEAREKTFFWSVFTILVVASLYLISGFAGSYSLDGLLSLKVKQYGFISLLMILAAGGIFIMAKNKPIYIGIVAILLVFIDLALPNKSYKNSEVDVHTALSIREDIKAAIVPREGTVFRYRPDSGRSRVFRRNMATYYQFYSMDGFYSFNLSRPPMPAQWPSDDLMSVSIKSVVVPNTKDQVTFINQEKALAHHRMTYQYISDPDLKADPNSIDFRTTTVLPEDVPNLPLGTTDAIDNEVTMTKNGFSQQEYQVTTAKSGLLVLAEYWFPHWKAYVDGKPVEVLKANHFMRGVVIPEGSHTVLFKYSTPYYTIGKWITVLTLLACIAYLVYIEVVSKINPLKTEY